MHQDIIQNEPTNLNIRNKTELGGSEDEVKNMSMKVGWCVNMSNIACF